VASAEHHTDPARRMLKIVKGQSADGCKGVIAVVPLILTSKREWDRPCAHKGRSRIFSREPAQALATDFIGHRWALT
jgi:hypothetical protein